MTTRKCECHVPPSRPATSSLRLPGLPACPRLSPPVPSLQPEAAALSAPGDCSRLSPQPSAPPCPCLWRPAVLPSVPLRLLPAASAAPRPAGRPKSPGAGSRGSSLQRPGLAHRRSAPRCVTPAWLATDLLCAARPLPAPSTRGPPGTRSWPRTKPPLMPAAHMPTPRQQ